MHDAGEDDDDDTDEDEAEDEDEDESGGMEFGPGAVTHRTDASGIVTARDVDLAEVTNSGLG